MNAGDDYDFKLYLGYNSDNLTITANNAAAIVFLTAQDATISVPSGCTATVTDGRSAVSSESSDYVACIYAAMDLDVQGNGTLTVTSTNNNGIRSTADLLVKNLTLNVTSSDNPLKGDESVTIQSGTVTLDSKKGDGIKTDEYSTQKTSVHEGDVVIGTSSTSPIVTITAYLDGIDAAYDVKVVSGTLKITNTTKLSSSTYSVKGIKADHSIAISGGTVTVTSYHDAIHANKTYDTSTSNAGDVTISGGTIELTSSILDGICSAGDTIISGGSVTVKSAGDEGIDCTGTFEMSAGTLTVTKA